MKYHHIKCNLGAEVNIGILEKGKPTQWLGVEISGSRAASRYSLVASIDKSTVKISPMDSGCRETLNNSMAVFFKKVSLDSPNRKLDLSRETILKFGLQGKKDYEFLPSVLGSDTHKKNMDQYRTQSAVNLSAAYKLLTTASHQKELFRLLDVVLGSVAILAAGPKAYSRVSKNPAIKTKLSTHKYFGKLAKNNGKNNTARGTLHYNGLSSYAFSSPELASLLVGLSRSCIQYYYEGNYKKFNSAVDITKAKRQLKAISKKEVISESDIKKLLANLKPLKVYLFSDKISSSPGRYPLNKYSWGMFKKFIKLKVDKDKLSKRWSKQGAMGSYQSVYGHYNYGFHKWCVAQKFKTVEFIDRPRKSIWG